MESPFRTIAGRRLALLVWISAAWGLLIAARLVQLQVVQHEHYSQLARKQQEQLVEIPAPRGAILDRNGETMAISTAVDSVFVNPMLLRDPATSASILAEALSLDRDTLARDIADRARRKRGFMWIRRRISPEESKVLRSLRYGQPPLDWIGLQAESQRFYPKGQIAAHVLGSVDHAETGNGGIELGLESELQGIPGASRVLSDVHRAGIESSMAVEPRPGANVTLTIDERIQFIVERELRLAMETHRAQTGSVVVMNPHSGDILAMASYPTFDPNVRPHPGEDPGARLNNAFTAPFEPGSVFKVFTMATALDTTRLTPESILPCGRLVMGNRLVGEAKNFFGPMTATQVLEKSSNAGSAQAGLMVGAKKMDAYVRKFGFGYKTGIPLPGESPGLLRNVEQWNKYSAGYIAFGHEIATTTLQLARACSVVANGGLSVRPRLVLSRQRPGEDPVAERASAPERILKPETAIRTRLMMEGVVLRGTGRAAQLPGYSAGGKTGSAQIFDFKAKRYTHEYNSSFMGFAPVANPQIVVVVTLNGAREYGGAVAAPVFRGVAAEALRILEVPKDLPEQIPVTPQDDFEEGVILTEASDTDPSGLLAEVPTDPAQVYGPVVPDFRGKTARTVVEEAMSLGVPIVLNGKGIARTQAPPAGAILPLGEPVHVLFSR
ncbi:MAG: hypothetical protein IPM24_05835 [Bryobacterales bacterium]|nr:hypothetical protein [Bryobacterales bacterium]